MKLLKVADKKYAIQESYQWRQHSKYEDENKDFFDSYEEAVEKAKADVLNQERDIAVVVEVRSVIQNKKAERTTDDILMETF